MRLITFIFLLIAPSLTWATIYDKNAKLSNLGEINIAIIDSAFGGCWTNISEVRSYAVGKLEVAGATVSDDRSNTAQWIFEKKATFTINVNATRKLGVCIGKVSIYVNAGITAETVGFYGIMRFSTFGKLIGAEENLNVNILDTVGLAIREWEEQR